LKLRVAERDEALRELKRFNTAASTAHLNGSTTVADIFDAYVKDRKADGKDTRRMNEAWKQMSGHFGHLMPDQIDKACCREYTRLRRNHGVSNGGIRSELVFLAAAVNFGKHEKLYVGDKPFIHRPPAARPRERWLTKAEGRKLIDAAKAFHVKLWLQLAFATAGRPSHILQLTWDRVTLKEWTHPETGVTYYGSVNLDDPERDATRKGRARVPLNREAAEALKLAKEMAQTQWVIEYNGAPITGRQGVRQAVVAAATRAELDDVTPYVIRHTAGVWMAQAGLPMAEISQYMGHTSTAITERVYARFHPDHLQRGANALSLKEPKAIEDKRGAAE
jgi:integrase